MFNKNIFIQQPNRRQRVQTPESEMWDNLTNLYLRTTTENLESNTIGDKEAVTSVRGSGIA
jgi:hypothetical protein